MSSLLHGEEKETTLAAEQIRSGEKERAAGNRHARSHLGGESAAENERQRAEHTGDNRWEFGSRFSIWFGDEPSIPARTEGDSLPGAPPPAQVQSKQLWKTVRLEVVKVILTAANFITM